MSGRRFPHGADEASLRTFRRRFLGVALFAGILTAIGTYGFSRFPGYDLLDAAYMTVITLTAVGYEEVQPLTTGGRILASVLLVGGITTMGLYFALITSTIVEMDLGNVFRLRRTMKQIEDLDGHIIVCGAGRTGRQAISELDRAGHPHVVVEWDPEHADLVREKFPDALILEEDATRDETLAEAGIQRAWGLIAALNADTDNLFVTLSARDANPDLAIVARAHEEASMAKIRTAGADHVISPNVTGGTRMASMLLRPKVMSFLDVVSGTQGMALRLEEVTLPAGSSLAGHTLAEAQIPQKTGLIVIAVRHEGGGDGELVYNPGPGEQIGPGDVLIVLGRSEQVDRLREVVDR